MTLCKPRTVSPARIAANRRNPQKSTGPRTVQGKAQSRMNGLREGNRRDHGANRCPTGWKHEDRNDAERVG